MAEKRSWTLRLVLLLIALLPLVVAAAWWDRLIELPVPAVSTFLLSAVALVVFIVGEEFLREVVKQLIQPSVPAIAPPVRRRISGGHYTRKYLRYVRGRSYFVDQKGLRTAGIFTPSLDDVYVDVGLAHRAPHQVPADILARLADAPGERASLHDLLDHPEPRVLTVLGAPGSGKTTLLRHTALHMAQGRKGRIGRRAIPILLYLRDHARRIVEHPETDLAALLGELMRDRKLPEPPGWFQHRLDHGDCVVLLDGLDEVAGRADRRVVAGWVDAQRARYSRNHFVVTSRPHGYRSTRVEGAVVLQTQRLTPEQVHRFVHRWYLATVQRTNPVATRAEHRDHARRAADNLLARVHAHPGLVELTVNPLLLTMIANVHQYRGALPGSRAELYDEVCEVMLWRAWQARGLSFALTGPQREAVLREVAHTMMDGRVRDLERQTIVDVIERCLARVTSAPRAERFLADLVASGLILERGDDTYAYTHKTFQEYLTAAHLKETGLPDHLTELVTDDWWRETLLLYAARSDASPIVAACLDEGSVPALALAFACEDQARELAPELRRQLHRMLEETFETGTPPDGTPVNALTDRQRLLVAVQVVRDLHEAVELGGGRRLCAHPVTVKLYRLFQAMTANGSRRVPDAPHVAEPEPRAAGDRGSPAVTGVRGSDALAFVGWVNDLLDGERRYQLPTTTELAEYAERHRASIAGRVIWAREPSGGTASGTGGGTTRDRPVPWTPDGVATPEIDAATVRKCVEAELCDAEPLLRAALLIRSGVWFRTFLGFLERVHREVSTIRRDVDQGLRPDLDRDVVHALDGSLAGALTRTRAGSPEEPLDVRDLLTRARSRARVLAPSGPDFAESIECMTKLTDELAHTLDLALRLQPGPVDILDVDAAREPYRSLDNLMGTALSRTLDAALEQVPGTDIPNLVDTFARDLVDRAGLKAPTTYQVALDDLAATVATATDTLLRRLGPGDDQSSRDWAGTVAELLSASAIPCFERERPLTAEAAAGIRLHALCLAVEADTESDKAATESADRALGDEFRAVVVGVTYLQRRLDGEEPARETIMLATD